MAFWNWRKKIILQKIDSAYGDEFMLLVNQIERYAPPEYKTERVDYYYNYSSLNHYLIPLLKLLRILQSKRHRKEMDYEFAKEVCLSLKNFYDLKNKHSVFAILEDQRFIRKYKELFRFFYGRLGPTDMEIRDWIIKIKEEYLGPQDI